MHITGNSNTSGISAAKDTGTVAYNSTAQASYAENAPAGGLASTTGNVYGIYDISVGLEEYTAAYMTGASTDYSTAEGFGSDARLYNVYSTEYRGAGTTYTYYGDAVGETSKAGTDSDSWYHDYSPFISSSSPFFRRGGRYDDGIPAGTFYFCGKNGEGNWVLGFRPVLTIV